MDEVNGYTWEIILKTAVHPNYVLLEEKTQIPSVKLLLQPLKLHQQKYCFKVR